jgi:hypothetical protein
MGRVAVKVVGAAALLAGALSACGGKSIGQSSSADPGTDGGATSGSAGGRFAGAGGSPIFKPIDTGGRVTEPPDLPPECSARFELERIHPRLNVMLDRSPYMARSVGERPQYTEIVDAISAFASAPSSAGIDFSVGLFPAATEEPSGECPGAWCAQPALAREILPPEAGVIPGSLHRAAPVLAPAGDAGGDASLPGSPLACAMFGLTCSFDPASAERCVSLVIADGSATGCPLGPDAVVNLAVGVQPLYAIGIPSPAQDFALLERISTFGGFFPFAHPPLAGEIREVLRQVAEELGAGPNGASCMWKLPEMPPGVSFDPGHLNVLARGETGEELFYNIGTEASCAVDGGVDGWYYDDDARPTRILACGTACDRLSATGVVVEGQLGCGGPIPPH